MRKYLIIIFTILLALTSNGCSSDVPEVDVPKEVIPINSSHSYQIQNDDILPYLVIKTIPNEDLSSYIYSLTFYSNFPKKNITNRQYKFYQVDFYTQSDEFATYEHTFDSIDSVYRSYAQNFVPSYKINEYLKTFQVLVKYSFDKINSQTNVNETIEKEMSFKEESLQFCINDYNNVIDTTNYSFRFNIEKKAEEEFNRIKIQIDLDEAIVTGHYDIQLWVECDKTIIPFIGFYHYQAVNGNIQSVSDIQMDTRYIIDNVYYMIRYYSETNEINDIYYKIEME